MTKRKTPAKTSQNATKQLSESVEAKSNTVAAKTTKALTNASQKAPAKPRGRPKKVVDKSTEVEINLPAPVSKAIDVDSRTITYASAGKAVPSKYEQFKAWLVFKLHYYTSYFRGF